MIGVTPPLNCSYVTFDVILRSGVNMSLNVLFLDQIRIVHKVDDTVNLELQTLQNTKAIRVYFRNVFHLHVNINPCILFTLRWFSEKLYFYLVIKLFQIGSSQNDKNVIFRNIKRAS